MDHKEKVVYDGDKVIISKTHYNSLLEDRDRLECLEAAGVDNWDGYSIAMEMLNDG